MKPDTLRIGQGWDRHPLEQGETLVLGGVELDTGLGTSGHSDGDVLIHAVIDALLGAMGQGDIGERYPGTDEWEGVSSLDLLKDTTREIESLGWRLGNLDATICCESVRLSPHRSRMKENIQTVFADEGPVHVKYKTADGLGPVGENQAIDAHAICLLTSQP